MTDFVWPADLVPFAQSFYLRPHTNRSISPFTRQQKIYELSAPLWMTQMSFRGGYDGTRKQGAYGPRLDAFITQLRGGVHRVAIHDFRRPRLRGGTGHGLNNEAASALATSMVVSGFAPFAAAFYPGDYIGGDGRPHIVDAPEIILANDAGEATATFWPPLKEAVGVGEGVFGSSPGWFRMASDDAGSNPTVVGEAVTYDIEFIEDLTE